MLKTIVIASLLALTTIPVQAEYSEPICYIRLSNGTIQDLGSLCGQAKKPESSASDLTLSGVKITTLAGYQKRYYDVVGTVTNNTQTSQSFVKVFISTYNKSEGKLIKNGSEDEYVFPLTVLPNRSSTFKIRIDKRPVVFTVDSITSIQTSVNTNTCFANSSETEDLCNSLNPNNTQRY
jgi:hypothetical protein